MDKVIQDTLEIIMKRSKVRTHKNWEELVNCVKEYIDCNYEHGVPWTFIGKIYFTQCRKYGKTMDDLASELEERGMTMLELTSNGRRALIRTDMIESLLKVTRSENPEMDNDQLFEQFKENMSLHYSMTYNLRKNRGKKSDYSVLSKG